jgi:hypothetical protein
VLILVVIPGSFESPQDAISFCTAAAELPTLSTNLAILHAGVRGTSPWLKLPLDDAAKIAEASVDHQ